LPDLPGTGQRSGVRLGSARAGFGETAFPDNDRFLFGNCTGEFIEPAAVFNSFEVTGDDGGFFILAEIFQKIGSAEVTFVTIATTLLNRIFLPPGSGRYNRKRAALRRMASLPLSTGNPPTMRAPGKCRFWMPGNRNRWH